LICFAFGHNRITALDGSVVCARCKKNLKIGAVEQMREIDPEWYSEYVGANATVAIREFAKRNPGVLKL